MFPWILVPFKNITQRTKPQPTKMNTTHYTRKQPSKKNASGAYVSKNTTNANTTVKRSLHCETTPKYYIPLQGKTERATIALSHNAYHLNTRLLSRNGIYASHRICLWTNYAYAPNSFTILPSSTLDIPPCYFSAVTKTLVRKFIRTALLEQMKSNKLLAGKY